MEDTESNALKPNKPAKGHHFWLKLLIVLVGCLVYTLILEKSGIPTRVWGGFDDATRKELIVWRSENLLPVKALEALLDQTGSAMEILGEQFGGALFGHPDGKIIGRTLLSSLKGCLIISALKIGMLIYVNPGAIRFDRIAGIASGVSINWDAKPTLGEILFDVAKIIGTACVAFAYLIGTLLLGMLKFLLAFLANPFSALIAGGLVIAVIMGGSGIIGFLLPLFLVLIAPDLLYCGFRHYFCNPSEPREISVGVMLLSDAIAIVVVFFGLYFIEQLVIRLFGEAAASTPYTQGQMPGSTPLAQALQAGGVRAHLLNIFGNTFPIPALYIHTAFKNKYLFNE